MKCHEPLHFSLVVLFLLKAVFQQCTDLFYNCLAFGMKIQFYFMTFQCSSLYVFEIIPVCISELNETMQLRERKYNRVRSP